MSLEKQLPRRRCTKIVRADEGNCFPVYLPLEKFGIKFKSQALFPSSFLLTLSSVIGETQPRELSRVAGLTDNHWLRCRGYSINTLYWVYIR